MVKSVKAGATSHDYLFTPQQRESIVYESGRWWLLQRANSAVMAVVLSCNVSSSSDQTLLKRTINSYASYYITPWISLLVSRILY